MPGVSEQHITTAQEFVILRLPVLRCAIAVHSSSRKTYCIHIHCKGRQSFVILYHAGSTTKSKKINARSQKSNTIQLALHRHLRDWTHSDADPGITHAPIMFHRGWDVTRSPHCALYFDTAAFAAMQANATTRSGTTGSSNSLRPSVCIPYGIQVPVLCSRYDLPQRQAS